MTRPTSEPPPRVVSAEFTAVAMSSEALPAPVGVEIAFAGRSNVGKSSLLNALFERRSLVRTSSRPGCTRGVTLFEARLADGTVLKCADLPGYGYARRSKQELATWGPLIESYLLERPTLAAVVLLVDVRRGLEADDRLLLDLVASPPKVSRRPIETIVVATKMDKISASARRPALAKLRRAAGRPILGFSVKNRRSREDLWRAIHRAIRGQGTEPTASGPVISRLQSP